MQEWGERADLRPTSRQVYESEQFILCGIAVWSALGDYIYHPDLSLQAHKG